MATNTTSGSFRDNLVRVIAVIGLIAVLLLGAWGIIQLAFYLPTFFTNFSAAKESLSVSVPPQVASNRPFPLTWKHTGKDGEYGYSITYTCSEGLAFAAPVPTGTYQLVQCNTPFNYINATSTTPLIPVLAQGTTQASTTFTVSAIKLADGTVAVKGTANTRITVGAPATTTVPVTATSTKPADTTPKPTTVTPKPAAHTSGATHSTYVPSGRTTNLYGTPDLAVQIITAPQTAAAGSRIMLQFVVTNIGTNVAHAGWELNAILPYNPTFTYSAGQQQKLYPGDKIVYTLGYDAESTGGYYGQTQATIQVDPYNYLQEANKANNTATATYQVN